MKNMIRRTTLKVRDIQKSYDFYTEVLGMETYYNNEVTVKNDLLPGTKQGDKIHLIILKAQDPIIGFVFGHKGLIAGLSLEGTKFTKIWPDADNESNIEDIDEFNDAALD